MTVKVVRQLGGRTVEAVAVFGDAPTPAYWIGRIDGRTLPRTFASAKEALRAAAPDTTPVPTPLDPARLLRVPG